MMQGSSICDALTQGVSDADAELMALLEEPWPPVQPVAAAASVDSVLVNGLGMSLAECSILEALEPNAGHATETVGCWISPTQCPGSSVLPFADDLQSHDSTPVKRRRLIMKQSAPHLSSVPNSPSVSGESSLSPSLQVCTDVEDENDEIGDVSNIAPEDRPKYKKVHRALSKWLPKASSQAGWSWPKKYGTWAGLRSADVSLQNEIFAHFLAGSKLQPESVTWAKEWIRAGNFSMNKLARMGRVDEPFAFHKKSVLLTYQGRFGVFDPSLGHVPGRKGADDAIKASAGLATHLVHGNPQVLLCIEQVVDVIRQQPRFQVLRGQVETHVQFLAEAWCIDHWAWSLELCTKTYLNSGDLRLHLHLFLFRENGKIRSRNVKNWHFLNAVPTVSSLSNVRGKVHTAWSGLFYIVANGKIGCVAAASSSAPHKDFVVQPPWVLNMLGMGKMTCKAAPEHLVNQARDLPRLLSSMDQYVREKRNKCLEDHQCRVLQHLHMMARPFVSIPAVEQWLKEHEEIRWRYKFLVLVGTSMMGKTRFALSLSPAGRSLELNCVTGNEPDLREYDATQIDLLLLDEMPALGIIRQKKLMQCPPALVQLGASATNAFSYKVWVHQKKIVVSSNTWFEELEELVPGDRDWLNANSVVVSVQSPLWVPSPVASES